MSDIYVCVGRYAANPYTIKNVSIRVYCVEELCYYIRYNALFIDDDFFEPALFLWLDEECDLQSLSRKIKAKLRQDPRVETGVRELFQNVNYCSEKETEETIILLRSNREMTATERLTIHGDFFLNSGRLSLAADTYQELLTALDKKNEYKLLAKIYYNLGVVYARLFMFENAGEYFNRSYEISASKDSMVAYLLTLRMRLSEEQYLKKLREIEGAYDCSALVENAFEDAKKMYDNSEEPLKIKNLQQLKMTGNVAEYEKQSLKMASSFKDEYRDKMQE